jgi:hypothetical protein
MIQLDFFQTDEIVILKNENKKLKESLDKMRKALFARNGELEKKCNDSLSRLEIIERFICRGNDGSNLQMREKVEDRCY